MFYTTLYGSPLGSMLLASDGENLVGAWMEGQKHFGQPRMDEIKEKAHVPVFIATKKWLDAYFSGKKPAICGLPLAPRGSEFRKAVWDILRAIPYGECTTYGAIAQKIAPRMQKTRMSSQAVGGAVGHNPLSIIVPCHRVVGANGSLTGYAGGIEKKIKLLELEGVDTAKFFVPANGTAL